MKISLKFDYKGPINNIPALVQMMGMAQSTLQAIMWTSGGYFTDEYKHHSGSMS